MLTASFADKFIKLPLKLLDKFQLEYVQINKVLSPRMVWFMHLQNSTCKQQTEYL